MNTVWHGHIETLLYGRRNRKETAPYTHRLGSINFVKDGSQITFADLVSRSRYTGGLYGSATKRRRSLLRGTIWMDPEEGPSGVHVGIDIGERQNKCWLVEFARENKLPLLGSKEKPYGAVFRAETMIERESPICFPYFTMKNGDKCPYAKQCRMEIG